VFYIEWNFYVYIYVDFTISGEKTKKSAKKSQSSRMPSSQKKPTPEGIGCGITHINVLLELF
jgi:hypothetical protein